MDYAQSSIDERAARRYQLPLFLVCVLAPLAATPVDNPAIQRAAQTSAKQGGARAHEANPAPSFKELGQDRFTFDINPKLSSVDRIQYLESNVEAGACTDSIIRAQWQQDISKALAADAHFDNCQVDASIKYLRDELAKGERSALDGETFVALQHLGHVLHSIEDFYAHTNFVELAASSISDFDAVPRLRLWDASADVLLRPFRPNLISGTVLWVSGRCPNGAPSHHELNKDAPDSAQGARRIDQWSMTHYRATAELTKAAGTDLLRGVLKSPAWQKIVDHCGTTYGFALNFDRRRHE